LILLHHAGKGHPVECPIPRCLAVFAASAVLGGYMPNEDQGRWLSYQRVGTPALSVGYARANQAERQGRDDQRAAKPFAPGATLIPAAGVPGRLTFSPASNARDRDATSRFMRERTKDELVQIIVAPLKLVDWLPGFTRDHLHSSHQDIAISLAKTEAW